MTCYASVAACRNTVLIVKRTNRNDHWLQCNFPFKRRKENARQLFPATKYRAEVVSEDAGQKRREGDDAFSTCCRLEPGILLADRMKKSKLTQGSHPSSTVYSRVVLLKSLALWYYYIGEGCCTHDIITGCCQSSGTSVSCVWEERAVCHADADTSIHTSMPSYSRKHSGPDEGKLPISKYPFMESVFFLRLQWSQLCPC